MRERNLAFFVAHREIIAAAVFEIADAGDPYAIAVDERPRHHRHFWPPGPIMGRLYTDEPRHHAHKQRRKHRYRPPGTREPKSPNAANKKNHRQPQARPRPWQIGIIDCQSAPPEEQD